ncbi:unnamed protein product (macronuclear) [Paramecium tetraurelia]|uniref:Uncharacterized protein n=1 Tax=Paramecium tetraurelia TaxID=5888 RepID=A0DQ94_PARTE|nr:uncharacterized protein GSPATT00002611001 [Paramecium tetraurelia]CAK85211.1 unnamed protein product [Paramecium tetraurelia]|eukprot:XP_001452608.1 hypothetical protein (macronuclear) [Paramecium tetraurelia strain d4-2]
MSKRKPQFDIGKNEDDEEVLPSVGVINTPSEIQERKIMKIKGPKQKENNQNTKIVISAPPPSFEQAGSDQKLSTPPKKFQPTNIFNSQQEKLFFNTQPLNSLQLPQQQKNNIGLVSPIIEFKSIRKSDKSIASPNQETNKTSEILHNKLKKIKIGDKEHENKDITFTIEKLGEDHKIKIEPNIFEGLIEKEQTKKENNIVRLQCKKEADLHDLQLEFVNEKDYESFNL